MGDRRSASGPHLDAHAAIRSVVMVRRSRMPGGQDSEPPRRRGLPATIGAVHEVGGRTWSISVQMNRQPAHALGVRSVADLPVYDSWVPEPLEPEPPDMLQFLRAEVRTAAAAQWGRGGESCGPTRSPNTAERSCQRNHLSVWRPPSHRTRLYSSPSPQCPSPNKSCCPVGGRCRRG